MPNSFRTLAVVAALSAAATAGAQDDLATRGTPLLRRVESTRDGTVRLTFAVRPGICGSSNGIRTTRDRTVTNDTWNRRRDVEWEDECESGPGRLALDVRNGRVTAIRPYVGGRWRAAGADVTDLGQVPSTQVAGLLLGIAERGDGRASRDAIYPTTLADSATVWPSLLRIARSDNLERETRSQAIFWVGQAAGDKATQGLTELANDDERAIRDQAVFALSRRPADEGVPALIRIARTHRDPQTRRSAMFWLGQSKDPRALALFEELLTSKN